MGATQSKTESESEAKWRGSELPNTNFRFTESAGIKYSPRNLWTRFGNIVFLSNQRRLSFMIAWPVKAQSSATTIKESQFKFLRPNPKPDSITSESEAESPPLMHISSNNHYSTVLEKWTVSSPPAWARCVEYARVDHGRYLLSGYSWTCLYDKTWKIG